MPGHNLIDFDLPHLSAANPNRRQLQLPAVDTLRLNPLAFVAEATNVLLLGTPGVGKTHPAIALALGPSRTATALTSPAPAT